MNSVQCIKLRVALAVNAFVRDIRKHAKQRTLQHFYGNGDHDDRSWEIRWGSYQVERTENLGLSPRVLWRQASHFYRADIFTRNCSAERYLQYLAHHQPSRRAPVNAPNGPAI